MNGALSFPHPAPSMPLCSLSDTRLKDPLWDAGTRRTPEMGGGKLQVRSKGHHRTGGAASQE